MANCLFAFGKGGRDGGGQMAASNRNQLREQRAERWYQNRRVQAAISGGVVVGLFTLGAALLSRRSLPIGSETETMKARSAADWIGRITDNDRVFTKNSVYPRGFEALGPGTRVSVLQAIFPQPQGTLTLTRFEVSVRDGPFGRVWFNHDGTNDPTVTSVIFWFRRSLAKTVVWKNALRNFKDFPYTSKVLGKVLEYPDVKGYRIVLDDESYQLHPTLGHSGEEESHHEENTSDKFTVIGCRSFRSCDHVV